MYVYIHTCVYMFLSGLVCIQFNGCQPPVGASQPLAGHCMLNFNSCREEIPKWRPSTSPSTQRVFEGVVQLLWNGRRWVQRLFGEQDDRSANVQCFSLRPCQWIPWGQHCIVLQDVHTICSYIWSLISHGTLFIQLYTYIYTYRALPLETQNIRHLSLFVCVSTCFVWIYINCMYIYIHTTRHGDFSTKIFVIYIYTWCLQRIHFWGFPDTTLKF